MNLLDRLTEVALLHYFGFDSETVVKIASAADALGVTVQDAMNWYQCLPFTATEREMKKRLTPRGYAALDEANLLWAEFLSAK